MGGIDAGLEMRGAWNLANFGGDGKRFHRAEYLMTQQDINNCVKSPTSINQGLKYTRIYSVIIIFLPSMSPISEDEGLPMNLTCPLNP